MSIVNFAIPKTLDGRIKTVLRKKGFASRAELFRFSVIQYLEEVERFPLDDNCRITKLSHSLEQELEKKLGIKKLPSIRKQLARISKV